MNKLTLIDQISCVIGNRMINIDNIGGKNVLLQCVRTADVVLILSAIHSALTGNNPRKHLGIKNAAVVTTDGRRYTWPYSGGSTERISLEEADILLGRNPFHLIRMFMGDSFWEESLRRTTYEFSKGKIINIKFDQSNRLFFEFQSEGLIPLTDLPIEEIELVRLAIVVSAISRLGFQFFLVNRGDSLNRNVTKRFYDTLMAAQVQVVVISSVVGAYLSFPFEKAANLGWTIKVLTTLLSAGKGGT
jgi:hypothetical protein